MECKDVEYHIVDFIDKQLSQDKAIAIENHIATCSECKLAYDETAVLIRDFENETTEEPSAALRSNFYSMLEEEKQMQDHKVVQLHPKSGLKWKSAFQIAASFLLLFIGYYFGDFASRERADAEIAILINQTDELKENVMLAMLDNNSASKRIQAVNYSEDIKRPDEKVTIALINSMHNDSNINVRLAAAEALSRYSDLEIVKKVFIEALSTEKNPSLQISIIQFLAKTQEKRAIEPMQKLLEQPEIPEYVKAEVNNGISQII